MKTALTASLMIAALALPGCAAPAEQRLLTQFFAASRLRDLTALGRISTVVFEPAVDGIVTGFTIREVSGTEPKEVSISAPVKLPDGRTVVKDFDVSIRGGLITAISARPARSPVEGAAPPSTPRP